jgi:hypothetical protein
MRNLLLLLAIGAMSLPAGSVEFDDLFNKNGQSDVFGNKLQFDVQKVILSMSNGLLDIEIQTNFDNPALAPFYIAGIRLDAGDLFFSESSILRYGLVLQGHDGLAAGHIYRIDDPSTQVLKARDVLGNPSHADYRPNNYVWMTGAVHDITTVTTPAVNTSRIPGNNGVNGALFDVKTTVNRPSDMRIGDLWSLYFPLATCANDVVNGSFTVDSFEKAPFEVDSFEAEANAVHEPAGGLLIGGGLIAFVSILRRRSAARE